MRQIIIIGSVGMHGKIMLDNMALELSDGRPLQSAERGAPGHEPAAMRLSFVASPREVAKMEALVARASVLVKDPFANRRYRAKMYLNYSYPVGVHGMHYLVDVHEL